MGFCCGIVGLPNVGKSTLFNALLKNIVAQAANYPFCTIEPNTGRVAVPDVRLDQINERVHAQRVIPTFMEFVDIAGLVKGASKGEGLGNQFLGHIRQVDAIVHVVRCFDDPDVIHVEGHPDPQRDVDIINTELVYADFETVSKSVDRLSKLLKGQDKILLAQHACAVRLKEHLSALQPARSFAAQGVEEEDYLKSLHLLSRKPVLYAANVAESDIAKNGGNDVPHVQKLRAIAAQENSKVVVISAKIEEDLAQLDEQDAREYMQDLNMSTPGLHRLIQAGYDLLGLITYFTAGEQEVRAWTIPRGCKGPQAAGVIHSDFEKTYICAEVYHYDDLIRLGNENKIKEAGLVRKEGRDYVCQDGDIMHFLCGGAKSR